jgi:hypothetical protein
MEEPMNYNKLPAPVLAKLLALERHAKDLSQRVAKTQDGITSARTRLTGGFARQSEYDDVTASLNQLVADKPVLEKKLHSAQSTLSSCKVWLDQLPKDTVLEPVEVKADGHDLKEVRARSKTAEAELAALRAVPTPSADIEQRIRDYVQSMARPEITGVGSGERLKVIWPGAGWDSSGPREYRADILPLIAMLHPDAMVAALMREVERMANDPMPPAARQKRIVKLEAEIDALQRQALVLSAEPTADFPPWVLLGVKIVARRGCAA